LSLCSLIYSASAVPAAAHAPAKIGQVIENKLKIAAAAISPRGAGGSWLVGAGQQWAGILLGR